MDHTGLILKMAKNTAHPDLRQTATSQELLARMRQGDERALSALFRRHGRALRQWAQGRLPKWARGVNDTADIVQDALLQTFRRIDRFEDRGKGALQAYLRQAVINRIRDEIRRVAHHQQSDLETVEAALPSGDPSPFQSVLDIEQERKYKEALTTLTDDERLLVVGRLELGYNYEQLALIANRSTPEAARIAVRRAVVKVAQGMSGVSADHR